jgi:hypothetical protein
VGETRAERRRRRRAEIEAEERAAAEGPTEVADTDVPG